MGHTCLHGDQVAGAEAPLLWWLVRGAEPPRFHRRTEAVTEVRVREGRFWQKRYYDFNVFTSDKRVEKLRSIYRNPVMRGLVGEPGDWEWSSWRH